jgi:hypothetical protein
VCDSTTPAASALDVAGRHWPQPDRLQVTHERHRHARFVAIGVREHDAGRVGLHLQDRADQRVELGVDHRHRLAVRDGVEHDAGSELHRPGHLDDQVDRIATRQHLRVAGQHRRALLDQVSGLACAAGTSPLADAGLAESAFGMLRRPIGDADEPDAGHGRAELERDGPTGRAGAHHADPDRASMRLTHLLHVVDGLVERRRAEGGDVHDGPCVQSRRMRGQLRS